jgi:hypothetical protein
VAQSATAAPAAKSLTDYLLESAQVAASLLPPDFIGQIQINIFKGGGSVSVVPKHDIIGIGSFKRSTTPS